MRRSTHLAGLIPLSLACTAFESPLDPVVGDPAALAVVRERVAFSETITLTVPNFCTGELTVLTGRFQVNNHTLQAANGGFHAAFHSSFDLRGTGFTSGDPYHLKETSVVSSHLKPGDQGQVFTQEIRTRLHRQGTPTMVSFVLKAHVTQLADGSFSVSRSESFFEC